MITFLFASLAFGASLYDLTEGRLGKEQTELPLPVECEGYLAFQKEDWVKCAEASHRLYIDDPLQYFYGQVSVAASIRGQDLDAAFINFEPLLEILDTEWSDSYWSIVLLEAWLLSELNLHKEALALLKAVPEDGDDAAGRFIVKYSIQRQRKSARYLNRMWSQALAQGYLSSWSWWHRATFESDFDKKRSLFERMLDRSDVRPQHFVGVSKNFIEQQEWNLALMMALDGLSHFPNSRLIFKQAILVASHEQGNAALGEILERFPEHTKAMMVQSFLCAMNDHSDMALEILNKVNELGDRSALLVWLEEQLKTSVIKE